MGGNRDMTEAILKIEILSDMCCGSGEGDGIRQDISSTYICKKNQRDTQRQGEVA